MFRAPIKPINRIKLNNKKNFRLGISLWTKDDKSKDMKIISSCMLVYLNVEYAKSFLQKLIRRQLSLHFWGQGANT